MQIAALYIRVSTDDQAEYSPDAQKRLLIDYAKKNDLKVSEDYIFIDGGISGRKAEKRPEFMRMIGLAKSKEKPFNKILVWKFSRFARNQEESIVYKNMLKRDGVDVISISEPIIDGPFGSLIERIIEWMDEYYSIRLSGEVMRGMTQKALKDGVPASPPFGYRLKDKKYVIEEDEAKIVRYIFENVAQGKSITSICRSLLEMGVIGKGGGRWHSKRIRYLISNPAYIGNLRWNFTTHQGGRTINDESDWIIKEGTHEPIVSKELFDNANSKINALSTTRRPVSSEVKHYLAGLLRCSSCGGTLVFNSRECKKREPRLSYRCNMYNKGACNTPNYIRVENIESHVKQALNRDIKLVRDGKTGTLKNIVAIKGNVENEKEIILKQLSKIKDKYVMAKDAYLAGIDSMDEYKETKLAIQNEENKLLEKLKSVTSKPAVTTTLLLDKLIGAIEIIDSDEKTTKEKNDYLKSFIDRIIIDVANDTLEMKYYVKN